MVKELKKKNNMAKSGFKMKGSPMYRNYGIGTAPTKKISFSKISKSIGASKLGKTVVGDILTKATGAVGKVQDVIGKAGEKIRSFVNPDDALIVTSDVDTSTEVDTGEEIDLEKVKVGPIEKKSPYKKGIGKYAKKAKGNRGYKMKRK